MSASAVLRTHSGTVVELDVARWHRQVDAVERRLLASLIEPIIDVGCGPGRIVAALAADGRVALGVDSSPTAVQTARRNGASALNRSVFAPLPGEQRWRSVVLLDGNIGIGGDPVVLLRRVAGLLAPGGLALIEIDPPGACTDRLTVRIEADDASGPWFPWARVSADDIERITDEAGLDTIALEQHGERWFARAVRP